MTLPLRFLAGVSSPLVEAAEPPSLDNVESDYVVIMAALLCALICAVGLVVVARCTWLRRRLHGGPILSSFAHNPAPPPPAIKGLKKKILRSLPTHTFNAAVNGKLADCAICLTELVDIDEIRVLPECRHVFHVNCIDAYVELHHVWNCSQAGALVASVLQGDLRGLGKALSSDKIVEPRRAPLIPGMEAVKRAAIEAGAFGCTISGAGPTAVAVTDDEEKGKAIGELMVQAFLQEGCLKASAVVKRLDRVGARLVSNKGTKTTHTIRELHSLERQEISKQILKIHWLLNSQVTPEAKIIAIETKVA